MQRPLGKFQQQINVQVNTYATVYARYAPGPCEIAVLLNNAIRTALPTISTVMISSHRNANQTQSELGQASDITFVCVLHEEGRISEILTQRDSDPWGTGLSTNDLAYAFLAQKVFLHRQCASQCTNTLLHPLFGDGWPRDFLTPSHKMNIKRPFPCLERHSHHAAWHRRLGSHDQISVRECDNKI